MIFLFSLSSAVDARTDFDRMEQLAATEYGQPAVVTLKAWRAMIEKNRTEPDPTKLEHANAFVNDRISYASDMSVWGVEDYWATPLELFGKGKGDCEDYAIAKYITLRLMDIPVQKLRLVYVRARIGPQQTMAHMVLSYFETPTSVPLILDNQIDAILPATRRGDLFPVFSFNHEGLWMEGERTSSGDPTARLSRWRDVLQRMRREGIDPSWTKLSARSLMSWKNPKFRPTLRKTPRPRPLSQVTTKHQARVSLETKNPAPARIVSGKPKTNLETKKTAPTRIVSGKSKTNLKTKKTASTRIVSGKSKTKTVKHRPPSRKRR